MVFDPMSDKSSTDETNGDRDRPYPVTTSRIAGAGVIAVIAIMIFGYGGYVLGLFPRIAAPLVSVLIAILGIIWFYEISPHSEQLSPWMPVSYGVIILDILLIEGLAIVLDVSPPEEMMGLYLAFAIYLNGHWYATEARLGFLPESMPQLVPKDMQIEFKDNGETGASEDGGGNGVDPPDRG